MESYVVFPGGTYIATDDGAEVWEGNNLLDEVTLEPRKDIAKRYSILKMLDVLEDAGLLEQCLAD